ncbi:MAG: heme-binding domain-containing protein [Bacteroidales bacterium]|nr:heme-binding domain-containing protein [Bacteroidales bacterium]MCF8350379.1 heme-binding domain-containing protein [Bacteroidales bacterium]MCF8375310.1 heme-binding domain-containing protein [Bacteroidales bacterium]MCF8400166.1 heme-binding domain-containing protein [Bacteroidales bacterium]
MKKSKTWSVILIVIAILIIMIQFIPVSRENPEVQGTPDFNNERTHELVRQACYDCHSHETDWPWYAYVAPVSWLVASDVHEGREHFNMSVPPFEHGDEAAGMVEKGTMPLDIYQWMHPEARFTEKEKQDLIGGLRATFGQSGEDGHEDHEH